MGVINQRLKSYFKEMKIVQERVAEDLGATKQQMSNWLADTKIPLETLTRIFLMFENMNARWIFTGTGEMLTGATEKPYNTTIPQRSAQEPTSPYCKHCEEYRTTIEDLRLTRDLLLEKIADLERRHCCPGELEGGVEKSNKAV